MQSRTTLVEVPSGKIELVFNGLFQTLQFNCSCEDALPHCKAMCCRNRTIYNVQLKKEETQFQSIEHPALPGTRILASNKVDDSCIYLDGEAKCKVHETGKPWACQTWHCSPNGKGDGVKFHDNGFILMPMNGNIQDSGQMAEETLK